MKIVKSSIFFCLFCFAFFHVKSYNAQDTIVKLIPNLIGLPDTIRIQHVNIDWYPKSEFSQNGLYLEALLQNGTTSLGDYLSQNSTIQVNSYGPSGLQSVSLRGTGANHTQVFWNGFQITSPTLGSYDFSNVSSSMFSRINVQKGANAMIHGQGGLGGAVMLNTEVWDVDKKQTNLELGWNSLKNRYGDISFRTKKNRYSTFTNIGFQGMKNEYTFKNVARPNDITETLENALLQRATIIHSSAYSWGKTRIEANVWLNGVNRELPKLMVANDFGTDAQLERQGRYALTFKKADYVKEHKGGVSYMTDRQEYFFQDSTEVSIQTLQSYYQYYGHKSDKFVWRVKVNQQNDRVSSAGFSETKERNSIGAVANMTYWKRFNKKSLSADLILRSDWNDQNWNPLSPSIGFLLDWNRHLKFRGNVTSTYRYPSLNDLYWSQGGNTELRPENGQMAEFGFEFNKGKVKESFTELNYKTLTKFHVNAFYGKIKDWIVWLPQGSVWTAQNIREVQNSGIEAGFSIIRPLYRAWEMQWTSNYAYTISENRTKGETFESVFGEQLIYVPQHKVNSQLVLQNSKNHRLYYTYEFTSKRNVLEDASLYMPHYMLSGLGYEYTKKQTKFTYRINLRINNLLNKDYQVIAYRPMPGRHFQISLNLQL